MGPAVAVVSRLVDDNYRGRRGVASRLPAGAALVTGAYNTVQSTPGQSGCTHRWPTLEGCL